MKVILKQDVATLGFEGDIKNVANGYARNFLIPKGLVMEANEQNIKLLGMLRKKIEVKRLRAKEEAEKLKETLAEMVITMPQKVGEEQKLYGSVTTMDIASLLEKQGIIVDKRKIILDKPIKTLGEFEIKIKLRPEVTGKIKLSVVPEEQP